jgi:hypothetical protein
VRSHKAKVAGSIPAGGSLTFEKPTNRDFLSRLSYGIVLG